MKLTQPKVELYGETPIDAEGTFAWIERAARICYNSENKITKRSAVPFIERLLKQKPVHGSVLEHSNIVLRTGKVRHPQAMLEKTRGAIESDFIFSDIHEDRVYLYGNYRAFAEYSTVDFFQLPGILPKFFPGYDLVTDPKDIPDDFRALTVCFHTDRIVTHQIIRHRHKTAFSMRSQRYCNESVLEIIKPFWYARATKRTQHQFRDVCRNLELAYQSLKKQGHSNQEARAVLPNCTSTVLVVTAYMTAWEHFFNLRISSAADPGIHKLMESVQHQMCHAGYL